MRILGLIGGTSWHSTAEYYRNINQAVNDHFGDNTNPPLLLFNLNQSQVHQHQREGNWDLVADLVSEGAIRLQKAGAESIIFCANTPHKVFETVGSRLQIPILHIADATAKVIQSHNLKKVCFLGTKFSMEEEFITSRISERNIEVIIPDSGGTIDELHRIIQEELTFGRIVPSSKQYVLAAIKTMTDQGAEGVILGCTEFPLMLTERDLPYPIFNTTEIHSKAATEYILGADQGAFKPKNKGL